MGGDAGLHLLGEVGIDSGRGIRRQQGDALGDLAAHQPGRTDDCYGLGVEFDDYLSAILDSLQDPAHILCQIRFADVENSGLHTADDAASSCRAAPAPRKAGRTTRRVKGVKKAVNELQIEPSGAPAAAGV